MNNKNLVRALVLIAAICGCATGAHAADDAGWYVGGGGGGNDVRKTSSWSQVTTGTLATSGFTSTTLIDRHDTAWKLFGGYQFNENFAVEGAYHDLGSYQGVTTVTAPAASTAVGKWDAYAGSVSAVGIYPVVNRFAVFGKVGLAVTRLKVNVAGPAPYSPNATRVQPLLGFGVKFDFNKTFGVRGEFERFNNVGDGSSTGQSAIHVWTVSAQVRF